MSDRIEKLCRAEVSQQVPAENGTRRMAYQPTPKGKALRPRDRGDEKLGPTLAGGHPSVVAREVKIWARAARPSQKIIR
jgi:hypothetical protein